MVWLPCGEKSLRIRLTVSTEYRRVTDRRTDRQTSCYTTVRAMHTRRAVKNKKIHNHPVIKIGVFCTCQWAIAQSIMINVTDYPSQVNQQCDWVHGHQQWRTHGICVLYTRPHTSKTWHHTHLTPSLHSPQTLYYDISGQSNTSLKGDSIGWVSGFGVHHLTMTCCISGNLSLSFFNTSVFFVFYSVHWRIIYRCCCYKL